MKKILLAGVAVAAVSAASGAMAAEPIKLGLGGYAKQWVGYVSNSDDAVYATSAGGSATAGAAANKRVKFDEQGDNQISFKGSTKLDNGLSVEVNVDTVASQRLDSRATGTNKNVKRAYATVSGGFGAVELGQQDNVGFLIHNSAPDVAGIGGQDGDFGNWVVAPVNHSWRGTTYANDDHTADKVIYLTPAFAGFQAGFSYTPDIAGARVGDYTTPTSSGATAGDLYVGGVAYANEIGGVKVKADVGAGKANLVNLGVYQGGLNLGYAGFTVGGSYARRISGDNADASRIAIQGSSWDAGVSYETGPYSVSVTYYSEKSVGADANSAANGDDKTTVWALGGAYNLGPGVNLKASVINVEYKDAAGVTADKNSGWGVVTGLTLDF